MDLQSRLKQLEQQMQELQKELNKREPIKQQTIPELIESIVASDAGINPGMLSTRSKLAAYAWPRQMCMYFIRHYCSLTCESIGNRYGLGHDTVSHACRMVGEKLTDQTWDKQRSKQVTRIAASIDAALKRRTYGNE